MGAMGLESAVVTQRTVRCTARSGDPVDVPVGTVREALALLGRFGVDHQTAIVIASPLHGGSTEVVYEGVLWPSAFSTGNLRIPEQPEALEALLADVWAPFCDGDPRAVNAISSIRVRAAAEVARSSRAWRVSLHLCCSLAARSVIAQHFAALADSAEDIEVGRWFCLD